MDKELLEKLKKDLDIILEQKGVYSDKFDALKKKLLLEMEDKSSIVNLITNKIPSLVKKLTRLLMRIGR